MTAKRDFFIYLCIVQVGWSSSLSATNVNTTTTATTSMDNVTDEVITTTTDTTQSFDQDRLSDLKIIDQMLKMYDRRATPTNKIGQPTRVGCELFIRSFGSISEKTMDYQVDLYLRQHWEDPRLNNPAITQALDLNDPRLVQSIWKPEVYFPNAKEGEFQYVTVPNVLLRIEPAGHILYMLRLKMKFSCMMELNKYPLDVQVCTMEVASFSKTTRELLLEWNKQSPVDLSSDLKMPQFTVERVVIDHCEESSLIGNYSCLVARFHLSRSIGFHMVQSYIPTILIVVISWVSFWMDVDSVPGRTTLGVTTLLTVSSKSAGLNAETPQVSYVKAIDVWMGACTAFIFAALIEFTIVNYLWRKRSYSTETSIQDRTGYQTGSSMNNGDQQTQIELLSREGQSSNSLATISQQQQQGIHPGNNVATPINDENFHLFDDQLPPTKYTSTNYCGCSGVKVDEACRVLFPLNFVMFNVLYWWYYLYY